MINALDAIFSLRPESLDGIGMAVANNIDLLAMFNRGMIEAERRKALIDWVFIGENLRTLLNIGNNHRNNGLAGCILNRADFQFSITFNHADNRRFTFCPTPTLACPFTAKVGFVNFYFTIKRFSILKKNRTNLLAHSPGCFVGNASFSLNLLCGNTATSLSHQVDHIEPSGKWSAGLVEDGAGSRRDLITTEFTRIHLAVRDFIELRFLPTIRAFLNFAVIAIVKPFKAGVFIREHFSEIIDCEFLHFLFSHLIPSCVLLRYKYCSMKGT